MEFNSGFKGLIQYTRNGGNAIPKHAGPEAEGSNPTTGLTLFWARNPFWENFNYWQVSWNLTGQQWAQLHDKYMMMISQYTSTSSWWHIPVNSTLHGHKHKKLESLILTFWLICFPNIQTHCLNFGITSVSNSRGFQQHFTCFNLMPQIHAKEKRVLHIQFLLSLCRQFHVRAHNSSSQKCVQFCSIQHLVFSVNVRPRLAVNRTVASRATLWCVFLWHLCPKHWNTLLPFALHLVKEKVFWVLRSANTGCSSHNSISAKALAVPTVVFSAGITTKLG